MKTRHGHYNLKAPHKDIMTLNIALLSIEGEMICGQAKEMQEIPGLKIN
jgi:hypothetical protein